ncbi:unnamed protein product [Caretta caretta]
MSAQKSESVKTSNGRNKHHGRNGERKMSNSKVPQVLLFFLRIQTNTAVPLKRTGN